MRFWSRYITVAIAVFASTSTALIPASSETAISVDNNTYLAPLYGSCPAGSSTCGTVDGEYLVMLHKGYKPSSHLSYFTENLHIDPVKEWQLEWFNKQHYIASDVSADSLNPLRQDPGIEGIEEGSWFEMVEVDRCQNSAFSEDETKQCYDVGPFDACKNEVSSEDEMWICGKTPESEESEPFEATLVDRYRVPEYSEEERAQYYVAELLRSCEDPKHSEEQKRICYQATLLDPCESPMLTEAKKRSCQETSLLDPRQNPEHSRDQMRSCLDADLVDSGNDPIARQSCAGEPEARKSAIYGRSEEQ